MNQSKTNPVGLVCAAHTRSASGTLLYVLGAPGLQGNTATFKKEALVQCL